MDELITEALNRAVDVWLERMTAPALTRPSLRETKDAIKAYQNLADLPTFDDAIEVVAGRAYELVNA